MNAFQQAGEDVLDLDQGSVPSAQTADQLRTEFDRTFALPARQPTGNARDFVVLQVAGQRYALPTIGLRAIERMGSRDSERNNAGSVESATENAFDAGSSARLDSGQTSTMDWVRVPSSQAALLGIRAFSGRIVPVFALATLLGLQSSTEPTHYALVSIGDDLVALAFDVLLRFTRVEPEQIFAPGAAAQPWEEATLSNAGEVFPVLGFAALLRTLTPDLGQSDAGKNLTFQNGKS